MEVLFWHYEVGLPGNQFLRYFWIAWPYAGFLVTPYRSSCTPAVLSSQENAQEEVEKKFLYIISAFSR